MSYNFDWCHSCTLLHQFNRFAIDCFRCAACYKCFLSSNKLKYHIRRTHLPMDGLYSCTICTKDFKNLRLLLNHQKSHIRINCPHCNKAVTASNYEQHVRTIHACLPSTKRKSTAKADASAKKRKSNEKLVAPSNPKPQKTVQVSSILWTFSSYFVFECSLFNQNWNYFTYFFLLFSSNSEFRCEH